MILNIDGPSLGCLETEILIYRGVKYIITDIISEHTIILTEKADQNEEIPIGTKIHVFSVDIPKKARRAGKPPNKRTPSRQG